MKIPLYLRPFQYASYVWSYSRWIALLSWTHWRRLDAFLLQRAARLYADQEISGGKFREFAMRWAAGEDIYEDVKWLEDGGR